jgi:hypothetical protein
MSPPIGVTGSDVRLENRAEPLPEGGVPQRQMALGMVCLCAADFNSACSERAVLAV